MTRRELYILLVLGLACWMRTAAPLSDAMAVAMAAVHSRVCVG